MDHLTLWCAFQLDSVSKRCNKRLTNLVFLVCIVSWGTLFFPLQFVALVLHTQAINRGGKKVVHNFQYGPQTGLVRGGRLLQGNE